MDVVNERCAGLDVHKKTVVCCVLRPGTRGLVEKQIRTFGTMTRDLEAMADWLALQEVTHVAMEATGAYWKPIYNVLEGRFTLLVGNAEHLKAVPGRKTDIKDAEWLATLLRHGLVRASFIPDRRQRELRELTRYRTALIRERAREVNRLQKTLEGANIKLAAVLTDIMGVSGQRILDALTQGETDVEAMADLAHWRVQPKRVALEQSLVGNLSGTLRFVVRQQLDHIQQLDRQIEECDKAVAEEMRPFAKQLAQLDTIPGVGPRTAECILAEIGPDMSRFPSAKHLAAWSGMAPGNRASGGKRRSARTRKGSPWLKAALSEAAWGASHCKEGYLPSQFHRLAARRGKNRAIVAVGHSILVMVYQVLTQDTTYKELGTNYFDERTREASKRRAIQRLMALGYEVTLEPLTDVA